MNTIRATVNVGGQQWTITGNPNPNPLVRTPRILATVGGHTVDLDCGYRQVISLPPHAARCRYMTAAGMPCTCAPQPVDEEALWAAAVEVLTACIDARRRAEKAAEVARLDGEERDYAPPVRLPRGCEGCPSAVHGGVCTCC